ncbi:MAG: HDOD domain-containing protein [Verrucomicrobia bacterium]|nr:HDOD domain-containing protein [Verrucomicrobiota bacterium]
MSGAVGMFAGSWWTRLLSRVAKGRWRWNRGAANETAESAVPETDQPTQVLAAEPGPVAASGEPVVVSEAERMAVVRLEPPPREPPNPEARARTLPALEQLQQIPALQSFARNFLRTLGNTDADVRDVVEVVQRDSALCVRVLRMANSVLVSPVNRIEDLDTAVQMLGLTRVRNAAQALFTLRDGNRVVDGFDWRHLWMHAIGTAELAGELDRRLRREVSPALHVAALLHDVGKIVLSMVAPEDYRAILAAAWQERGRLEDLERTRLGVDHREAGSYFARQAGLPEVAVQAIAHHDRPEEAESFRFEVALVTLANHLSKAHGLGFSGAHLEAGEGDFAAHPAWRVIEMELGRAVRPEEFEAELAVYAGMVRSDLREMREAA